MSFGPNMHPMIVSKSFRIHMRTAHHLTLSDEKELWSKYCGSSKDLDYRVLEKLDQTKYGYSGYASD